MSLKSWRSILYTVCHAPEPVVSDLLPQQLRDHIGIYMYMISTRHHSIKVPKTTVENSVVGIATELWRHLTHKSWGAWHTMYALLHSNCNGDGT